LKSIFSEIATNDIPRLRLGIGTSDRYGEDLVSFVLGKFDANETKIVNDMIDRSVEAIDNILSEGFAKAMELTNYKKQDKVN
jgi:PTH1 family peptidyl-tRNA hydrolase